MSEKNTAADCGRPPRTPKQTTQHLICAVILKFLYHGLRILYRYDDRSEGTSTGSTPER